MKIRPISDIHLEFGRFHLPEMEGEEDQVLCIAGDLNPSMKLYKIPDYKEDKSTETFFESLLGRFKDVIYISGNHEYYWGDIHTDDEKFKDICKEFGFTFLQKEIKIIDDVVFIGCTLWTDFDNQNEKTMNDAGSIMSDYSAIKDSGISVDEIEARYNWNGPSFTPKTALLKHYEYRRFIFNEVKAARVNNKERKVVVLSHHAPHENSIHEHYRASNLNGAYYSDLEHEILINRPNLWVHGHVHNSMDYVVGETRVVCNPRGYHVVEENNNFNPFLTIEV